MNKINGDFFNAVRNASMKGTVDQEGGVYGTRKITGYVCKVHGLDDEREDLRGTVDVQEFGYEPGEDKYEGAGHHEGVKCSAIQPNKNGLLFMPSLYSDVVIAQDPVSFEEYVIMYSHVDAIRLQSHNNITVGVVETEEFKESESDDDSPDIDDLKETGNTAISQYTSNKIIHTVKTKDGNVIITQSADTIQITAKDTNITLSADGNVNVSAKNITITSTATELRGNQVEVKGNSFIRKGQSNLDGQGGFCGIPVCPFTGAVHTGSIITQQHE